MSDQGNHNQKNVFDYKKLGFMCGLEIHQQLSGKKLFCNCQCRIRKDSPDFTITRRLRASAGE
jgi:Glu-tRNA(Gln) amidotransferase subunit E-like FAD-binding protein